MLLDFCLFVFYFLLNPPFWERLLKGFLAKCILRRICRSLRPTRHLPFFNLTQNLTEKFPSDFQIRLSDFRHWEFSTISPNSDGEHKTFWRKFLRQILLQIIKGKVSTIDHCCLFSGSFDRRAAAGHTGTHLSYNANYTLLFSFLVWLLFRARSFSPWQSSYLTRSPAVWSSPKISNEYPTSTSRYYSLLNALKRRFLGGCIFRGGKRWPAIPVKSKRFLPAERFPETSCKQVDFPRETLYSQRAYPKP
jgi:hypothetical protein